MNILYAPWPWYVSGPIIGLTVPLLLLLGNKSLGISSTLRQICAICAPGNISLFHYNWKKDIWNLYFIIGIFIGGLIGGILLANPDPERISSSTLNFLSAFQLNDPKGLMPVELFNWSSLLTIKGFLLMVVGGFLVGFGTRYAGGCTSGHGILGLSALQWPSLVAIVSFFVGGILFSHFVLPFILSL
ncbi:MAG: YeeE/YedE family protein [Cyclobacteriaceae bacterium]|nr:YeeE/YedE family protein [Cyclobacteriaceae bacterium]